jgi:hypothetical protein
MSTWKDRVKVTEGMWRSLGDALRAELAGVQGHKRMVGRTVAAAEKVLRGRPKLRARLLRAAERYARPGGAGESEWFGRCVRGVSLSGAEDPDAVCANKLREKYRAYYGKAEGERRMAAAAARGRRAKAKGAAGKAREAKSRRPRSEGALAAVRRIAAGL